MKKWFDRPFNFDLPVWLFPNLVERLRGTPARAEEMVRLLPPPFLTRRDGAHWSIQENLGHLLDLSRSGSDAWRMSSAESPTCVKPI